MDTQDFFRIEPATLKHVQFAERIAETMRTSAVARGTGIAGRTPELIRSIILENRAIVATTQHGDWAGFCYRNIYQNGKYVSCSGLIVCPDYRGYGLANKLKEAWFTSSQALYPMASLIGITTNPGVMKINSRLGFHPVGFEEMPKDEAFWNSCKSCVNHDILVRTGKKYCLCTAMLFDTPAQALKKSA